MVKIVAHVPSQQYGYFELSGSLEDKEQIERLYNYYAEVPLIFKGSKVRLTAFVGDYIYFDEIAHTYTNEKGDVYLSGSQYAASLSPVFETEKIVERMTKGKDIDPNLVKKMWKLKSDASLAYGNAIHYAMQLYEQFGGVSKALEKETHIHDHPAIKKAVESFYEAHKDEYVISEAVIVDHDKHYAGQVDRLLIVDNDKKICRIQDYKTNADIKKSIDSYWLQLKFYAGIMMNHGWTVEGLDIFWWNGTKWETFSKESNDNDSLPDNSSS